MSLDSFLRDHPRPDEESIRDLLSGHLCRCTGYTPIVRAAIEAAAELADQSREKTDA
jgi:2-furoyl-CoA dehydrogenase 2Fe-2S iron sulfur subunit